jgi:hypothetical protein
VIADKIVFDLDFSCAKVVGESGVCPYPAVIFASVIAIP